ncbi:MAG: response regulator transcription factor [Marinoscillum sp.]
MNTNKIIIADDHVLFIEGLKVLLSEAPEVEIVGTAGSGKELISLLRNMKPDVVLLDINMPDMNGIEALKQVKQIYPATKIIMLSTYTEQYLIELTRKNGANGYLAKTTPKEKLLEAIKQICAGGEFYLSKKAHHKTEFDEHDQFVKQFNLTRRELEIMGLIKQGLTSNDIAQELTLSVFTIRTHRKNLMQKLGLSSTGALIKFMLDQDI